MEDRARELIEYVARALVDEPDAVEVHVVEADRATMYELSVEQRDLGKVIGRDGRTARALRTLLASMGSRDGKRAILDILD
ncbi:MAG: KH domain-containing protein [Sandaracinaceae bacterium]|nr:KH domain-containing protein [Sandaracinaceae bacterium]